MYSSTTSKLDVLLINWIIQINKMLIHCPINLNVIEEKRGEMFSFFFL